MLSCIYKNWFKLKFSSTFLTVYFCKRQPLYNTCCNRSGPTYTDFIALLFFPNLEPVFFFLISAIFSLKCFYVVSAALDWAVCKFVLKENLTEEGKSEKHTPVAIQWLESSGRNAAWRNERSCLPVWPGQHIH